MASSLKAGSCYHPNKALDKVRVVKKALPPTTLKRLFCEGRQKTADKKKEKVERTKSGKSSE